MTSEKGKGFLHDGCCEYSDETVFVTDGERLRFGDAFDAGEIVNGEYVFASPICRQPGHSRSVYRSACPARGQIQVSAVAEPTPVRAIVEPATRKRRRGGLAVPLDFKGS